MYEQKTQKINWTNRHGGDKLKEKITLWHEQLT